MGCFNGYIGSRFKNERNWQVYGVDISKQGVGICRRKGIRAKVCNIESNSFPFPDGFFDAVFAGEIIEHLYDTERFVGEIHRVLKKGGFVIITTPNQAHWINRVRLLFGYGIANSDPRLSRMGLHIRFFTKTTLRELLEQNGFGILHLRDIQFALPFLARKGCVFARSPKNMGETLIVKAERL